MVVLYFNKINYEKMNAIDKFKSTFIKLSYFIWKVTIKEIL